LAGRCIELRGVEVHNLKHVDLDIPHRKLVVLCGVSGSGKTSLAIDTLYAEGQRRYIESFSAYTRQFLEQLDKPAAERIEGLPPAIAVTRRNTSRSSRATVGTTTEIIEYLRLLFARLGRVVCRNCGKEVRRDSPRTASDRLGSLPEGTRCMIAFAQALGDGRAFDEAAAELREDGFVRAIVDGRTVHLGEDVPRIGDGATSDGATGTSDESRNGLYVVVDRLTARTTPIERFHDSLETAFARGEGRCWAFVLEPEAAQQPDSAQHGDGRTTPSSPETRSNGQPLADHCTIDGQTWSRIGFSQSLRCEACGIDYPEPDPRLFSFNHPLGACPRCEGFGNVIDIDMDLVVPDPSKSIRDGTIAPWNTPAYAGELKSLLKSADKLGIPVDVPFRELTEEQRLMIRDGVPEKEFAGLKGFFAWLEKRKYKLHLRVFLSRWRTYRTCPECGGDRLRPEALSVRIGGQSIADVARMQIDEARSFFAALALDSWERAVGRTMLEQVQRRLDFLIEVGLSYLTLGRTLRTLSGGEAQRVALTAALGSSLVNMLYVLDEPTVGLHPRDAQRLIGTIHALRDRGNTVVVVEHEEDFLRAADQLIEIGPGAGERGGKVVFQGTVAEIENDPDSLTGQYLSGRRGVAPAARRRKPSHGWIRLAGVRGNNLKNVTVEFPLGVLCLVTGVSGSGKSTLVQDTLYGAICRRKKKDAPKPYPYEDVFGDGQIDDVLLVDQSPIGRSPRSNPVTYVKAFDEIRAVFADTIEARTHNYTAGHFSFNSGDGRCTACNGDGRIEIDMQFLADVYMTCSQCQGTRYRREILGVTYRGRNIAELLEMTVREAFTFFRGQPKVQTRLKRLIDVGLDYLRLGQPVSTLSAGEAQRLKLASYLTTARRSRTLFLLDEPTTGLHFSDVLQLLDCFDALLAVGHSLIVVEHNLQLIKAADYIIDLGPGAADAGGEVVVQGTPEKVARERRSATGALLAESLLEAHEDAVI
jgi:excinuclease ABC subunit A